MAYWIAKARPRRAPSAEDMGDGVLDIWDTAKPPESAAPGDRLFFYAGSPSSRVIGLGVLLGWRSELNAAGRHLFDVQYLSDRLAGGPRLPELRADLVLGSASFVKSGPSATLYPLTEEQGRRLFEVVAQLVPSVTSVWPDLAGAALPDVDLEEFGVTEGRARLVTHLRYERSRTLAEAKRRDVLARTGRLACEACGFDFSAAYGPLGAGFCEVHHTRAVADGGPERRTTLRDLAVLCSNCHRVMHRRWPMLTVAELRGVVARVA